MNSFFERISRNHILKRSVCLLLTACVAAGTVCLLTLTNKSSVAYLYDEHEVSVDYIVEKLDFDLSSDHMNYYYTNAKAYNTVFRNMLTGLNDIFSQVSNQTLSIEHFNAQAIELLKTYYAVLAPDYTSPDTKADPYAFTYTDSENIITELQSAWDEYSASADENTYTDTVNKIYQKYYNSYEYLFKIKNIDFTAVESGKSIWYYYVSDLLSTYYPEYVVQKFATGISQSTVKIGIKLKGGTTYTDNTADQYYDKNFDSMVSPFTMKFRNTGNVSLYLNLGLATDQEGDQKGVLAIILPYGTTFDTLKMTYSEFYHETDEQPWQWRQLIAALLSSRSGKYAAEPASFSTLGYASLETLIREWNAYAVSTYKTATNSDGVANTAINSKDNFKILPYNSTDNGLLSVEIPMICWADYGQNRTYYAACNNNLPWRTADAYQLIQYNFAVDCKTSLLNNRMSTYTQDDWLELYNREDNYEKFAGVSNFNVEGSAYFEKDNSNGTHTVVNAKKYTKGGYIECNYIDPTAENYLTNLRFDVRYRGYSPAYIRVRVIEQFTNSMGNIVAVNQLKFNPAAGWYDNRSEDLYFYSDKLYYSAETSAIIRQSNQAKYLTIPVIDGLIGSVADNDVDKVLEQNRNLTLKMTFYVEAVQPNRTEAYWGKTIDQINTICKTGS